MRKLSNIGKATICGVALAAALGGMFAFMDRQIDGCGEPLAKYTHYETATIVKVVGDTATLATANGSRYEYTQDRTNWVLDGFYNIQFSTKNGRNEIIKIWLEV